MVPFLSDFHILENHNLKKKFKFYLCHVCSSGGDWGGGGVMGGCFHPFNPLIIKPIIDIYNEISDILKIVLY